MKDEVIAWLGADRAKVIEDRKPGAIASGIRLVDGIALKYRVGGAAIRALHAAGEAGTPEDNWLYANPGKTRADFPPNVKAREAAKVKAEQQAVADAKAAELKAEADLHAAEEHTS